MGNPKQTRKHQRARDSQPLSSLLFHPPSSIASHHGQLPAAPVRTSLPAASLLSSHQSGDHQNIPSLVLLIPPPACLHPPPSPPLPPLPAHLGPRANMAYTDDAVLAKLSALNESHDSIANAAQWIMFHRYVDPPTAACGFANRCAGKQEATGDERKKNHGWWL